MYDFIERRIVHPLLDFSRGQKIIKYVNELEESQWWTRDKIIETQNDRLKALLKHAYDNVTYYRRIFNERGLKPSDFQSVTDLTKLPVLTKQIIRENFNQLLAKNIPKNQIVFNRTGGSTGEPLEFYCSTDEYRWHYAKVRRVYKWWGYEPGDKRAQIQLSKPHRSIINKTMRFFERAQTFVAWEATDNLPIFIKKLEKFQPQFISAYPGVMYRLAKFVVSQGESRIKPKAIITHSEQLYDFQRDLINSVFKCPIYSNYESFEMQQIAAECSEHTGYHIAAENVILEIVNNKDEPVLFEKEGRILNTSLFNYAMPLIRYETGDVGELTDKACPCGRGLPLLSKLNGRSTDYLLTRSGKKISGITLNFLIFATDGVEQFQIVQETYDEVMVKVVLKKKYPNEYMDKLTEKILNEYTKILGNDINIIVKFVDQIPTTRLGKRRVVVSKLSVRD